MLRSSLVRLRRTGEGEARVVFASEEDLPAFEDVIAHFRRGLRLGEVLESLKPLRRVYDPKLVDGIAFVVMKRVELETPSPVDPRLIRRALFEGGPALDEAEREARLREASARLGVDAAKYMYSDLDIERVITSVPELRPDELLREYNLAALQGLMLRALRVRVQASSGWREVLRAAKRLGLMYEAHGRPAAVDLYGPASLARLTERYGKALARLAPLIVSSKGWRLEAEVMVGRSGRVYRVRAQEGEAPMPSSPRREEVTFDSSVEEELYRKLVSALRGTGAEVLREPEALATEAGDLFIPDFGVRLGDRVVYIEVVGFWTREYLRSKLRKLSSLRAPVLLVVNEKLGPERFTGLGEGVVVYRDSVDVAPVYLWVKSKLLQGAPQATAPARLELEKPYESLEEVASRLGVSVDVLRSLEPPKGYVKLRSYFVREELLRALASERLEGARLSQLSSRYGPWVQEALTSMGYSLSWVGLTDAIVRRKAQP